MPSAGIESIDVLTSDGVLTGIHKPKPDIHRDGDWHLSVHVWIVVPDGRLLIQKRSLAKDNNPGLWDVSVAGHVSAGEGSIDSALREVEEEIGLILVASDLRLIGRVRESSVLHGGSYIDNEFHDVFLVRRAIDLSALVLQPEEVDEVALVSVKGLRTRKDLVTHPAGYELLFKTLSS
ncbi:MAG: NUDIX domain-containing protein [Thermoanaerobaculia bacterium]|nr:NUDIX domain-containing protein [Thermoanaerobaculia bacterium]